MVTKREFRLGLVALAACSLASCMDDKYDLDNVDMTVGTSGDLTLPQSSTGDILLSSFLDVTEDGIVQLVNGEYFLVETGNANVPDINITPIKINRPVLTDLKVHVDIDMKSVSSARSKNRSKFVGGFEIPNSTYTYTINPKKDKAYYELPSGALGTAPKEIVSLDEVKFMDDTRLEVSMKVFFEDGYEFIPNAYLDNITLSIPRGLYVKEASIKYWTMKDGSRQQVEVPAQGIDNENGMVTLTQRDCNVLLGKAHDITVSLNFDKAVTGMGGCAFENHQVSLHGKFAVGGTFRVESDDFNTDALTAEQLLQIAATGNYDNVCPRTLDINGTSSFKQDVHVASFSGSVKTTVNDIAPITLNDLPDFLNDPEVELDLANPVFYVEVNNPLPAEVKTRLALVSSYTNGIPSVERKSGEIVLPANGKCVVAVAENCDNLVMPEKYQGLPVVEVPIAELSDLLTKLPDAINVEIDDIVMDINGMNVPVVGTDRYKVTIDYMVYTPLELGEGTKLVYQGVEEGLAGDLEDVNTLNTKAIEIAAVVETNFPLELILSVDAQDVNGKSLVGTVVAVDDIVIKAHKGSGEFSEQDVKLAILPLEGHTMRELLEQMDKFVYRAVAEGDGKLLENARIKLKDIKITLKGGISYDAN